MEKICGRCGHAMQCQSDEITSCACTSINLSAETIHFLKSKTKYDCLCTDCLRHINQFVSENSSETLPKNRNDLQENVHYYMENGFFVFTEKYHFLKGHCCQNGCRHCVYGFHLKS